MKIAVFLSFCSLVFLSCSGIKELSTPLQKEIPEPLEIGFSLSIDKFTSENLKYAKSVGIE